MAGMQSHVIFAVLALASPALADDWPQFRGPNRDAISRETGLLRVWPEGGPHVQWSTSVAQGYAAAAILNNRVYFNDYDETEERWLVRCLSLDKGEEIWRFGYKRAIRPNHGITRSVPAVDGAYVFSMDPKCVLHCLDSASGKEIWAKNLVTEYKTVIPPWYNGQCPLIERDRVLIAPGGTTLVAALDKASGKPIWETPNPEGLGMSHSSLMPAEIGGVKQYLYTTLAGPLGVAADDGRLLWSFPWKFNVAIPTSPLPIGDGRIFYTSCYETETLMLRVSREGGEFRAEKVFNLEANDWNSETHTPIVFNDHIFGVGKKKRGLFTCLDMDGHSVWTSEDRASFDLGSYILADGMFFVLDGKTGVLRLVEANTTEYRELASAQVLSGPEVWAPMALSDGWLVVRGLREMKCLRVGRSKESGSP